MEYTSKVFVNMLQFILNILQELISKCILTNRQKILYNSQQAPMKKSLDKANIYNQRQSRINSNQKSSGHEQIQDKLQKMQLSNQANRNSNQFKKSKQNQRPSHSISHRQPIKKRNKNPYQQELPEENQEEPIDQQEYRKNIQQMNRYKKDNQRLNKTIQKYKQQKNKYKQAFQKQKQQNQKYKLEMEQKDEIIQKQKKEKIKYKLEMEQKDEIIQKQKKEKIKYKQQSEKAYKLGEEKQFDRLYYLESTFRKYKSIKTMLKIMCKVYQKNTNKIWQYQYFKETLKYYEDKGIQFMNQIKSKMITEKSKKGRLHKNLLQIQQLFNSYIKKVQEYVPTPMIGKSKKYKDIICFLLVQNFIILIQQNPSNLIMQNMNSSQINNKIPPRLAPLLIRISCIKEVDGLYKSIQDMVYSMKNSIYFQTLIFQYLEKYLIKAKFNKKVSKEIFINFAATRDSIITSKHQYLDYPNQIVNGFTRKFGNQRLMCINTYILKKMIDSKDYNIIKTYIIFTLCHELIHFIPRDLEIINEQQNSISWGNKQQGIHENGYRFEMSIFGGKINYLKNRDYVGLEKYIKCEEIQDEEFQKQYEEFKKFLGTFGKRNIQELKELKEKKTAVLTFRSNQIEDDGPQMRCVTHLSPRQYEP